MKISEMDDYYTHSISITLTERYPHGKQVEQAAVTLHGDGGLEWYVDAFRTALVAAGFVTDTAKRLKVSDE